MERGWSVSRESRLVILGDSKVVSSLVPGFVKRVKLSLKYHVFWRRGARV